MRKTAIDINCDMGESFGTWVLGHDEEVFRWISSANVACGFHAGDPHVMRKTVAMAREHGVEVGAHPGLPDLMGFGRRRMAASAEELKDYFTYQIGALKAFVESAGMKLRHVKQHGALTEMALADPTLARAMCEATRAISADIIWLTPTGSISDAARQAGLTVAEDFYTDRAYHPDKSLVSRKRAGSVIEDPAAIRARVDQLLDAGTVTTIEGQEIPLEFQSICVHGDTHGAVEIIRLVRGVCDKRGIEVRPLHEIVGKGP